MGALPLSPTEQKRRVAAGYDKVSIAYRADDFDYANSGYQRILALILLELSPADHVVELGCGCGVPVAQALSPRCRLTGVDLSAVQLARARALVSAARFLRADMATLHFRPRSLRAVVAFWSIIHVPLEDQPRLLSRVFDWLQPGGLFLATVGFREWVGSEPDWHGVPGATMYWSHADRATYLRWFEEAGFLVEHEDFVPEGDGGHTVFFARKPAGTAPGAGHIR
ncbi:MAG: class I SAM-dependent DNA methyltransferase [Tepidiformaceae bacterium]